MSSILINQLYAISNNYLDKGVFENSTFYLEKLLYEADSEDTRLLLAKSYIGEGKYHKAYYILKDSKTPSCRYLHAEVCIKINKFLEAEKALLTEKNLKKNILSKDVESAIPNGALGYYLLGMISEKLNRPIDANNLFKKCLELDPFMWCSFEKLCKHKAEKIEVGKYFSEINPKILMFNNKFSNMAITQTNSNNVIQSVHNQNNIINQPKDFSLSPDACYINTNSLVDAFKYMPKTKEPNKNTKQPSSTSIGQNMNQKLNNFINPFINQNQNQPQIQNFINSFSSNNNSVNRFNREEDSEYSHLSNINQKYQPEFRVFTDNSENEKQITTPVVNKDKNIEDYANLNNHHAFIIQKANNLRPFTYSNSPNQIGQDLNKIICNSEVMNKYNTNSNANASSGLNNVHMNNEFKSKFLDTSNIKPFNFNTNPTNNTNNEFTPLDNNDKETKNEGHFKNSESIIADSYDQSGGTVNNFSNNNNVLNNPSNNIFKNIKLSTDASVNNNLLNNINFNLNSNNFNNNKFFQMVTGGNNPNFNNVNHLNSGNVNKSYETYHTAKNSEGNMQNNNGIYNFNSGKFKDLSQLLKHFAEIVKMLALYQCKEVINLIEQLPKNHKSSGLILSYLGKAYFELTKYKECEKYYRECLKMEPYRLEGIEYFSSCLWHLKDQYQLCNLANHVLEQSLFAPETWIVLGNNYSLQKEHEVALKFFMRAIQLNSSFAYAYTLCGHEHFANESFVESKNFYSKAIGIDEKHLNAWWGLANILMKEECYEQAIVYVKKAISINSNSAILHSILANAYQQNKDISKALKTLEEAERLDPMNHMIKYQKANILFFSKKYDDSLKILYELKEKVPKEAPIHILMGHNYKAKRDFNKALSHYNLGLDLDQKDLNSVKGFIEQLVSEYE